MSITLSFVDKPPAQTNRKSFPFRISINGIPGIDNIPNGYTIRNGLRIEDPLIPDKNSIIPPDEPTSPLPLPEGIDYGYRDTSVGQNILFDAGNKTALIPSEETGQYGCEPWGSIANFPFPEAWWIWNTKNADVGVKSNEPTVFNFTYTNTTSNNIMAIMYYLSDNTAMFYHNNNLLDTDTGWYPTSNPSVHLSSWQIPEGYREVYLTLNPGLNSFSFIATNWSGAAGLIFALVNSSYNILRLSDHTISTTSKDWYTDNVSAISNSHTAYTNPRYINVTFNEYVDIPIVPDNTLKVIEEVHNDSNLTISEDGLRLIGTITFMSILTLQFKLSSGVIAILVLLPELSTKSTGRNYSPICIEETITVGKNMEVDILLKAVNPDPTKLLDKKITYQIVTPPMSGGITGNLPDITYIPTHNFIGIDVIEFQAYNSIGVSEAATITIDVV